MAAEIEDPGVVHTFRIEDGRLEYAGPGDHMPSQDDLLRASGIRILAEDGSVTAVFARLR